MRYQDLKKEEEEEEEERSGAVPACHGGGGALAGQDDDAIPLSDLSPPPKMRPSSPGTTAAPSGPPHTHHDLRYHHTPLELEQDEDHHRRQRPKQQSVQPPAATPSGLSMAFCAAYPFQRLAFTSLGKDRIFQLLYFLSGPFLFLMTLAIGAHNAADPKMVATVATTLMMVVWWLFECLPMGITSFLPVVMFPLMGVVPGNRVAMVYFSDQILILFGSCMLAAAVEEYRLHRRLALCILSRAGRSPYRLVLGFLSVTAFLSMWLSNTATAAMMAPLASAVMESLSGEEDGGGERGRGRLPSVDGSTGSEPARDDKEEEEEEEEEEIVIELPLPAAASAAGRRWSSLDERVHDGDRGLPNADMQPRRLRGQTEDPGALHSMRCRQQQGEGGEGEGRRMVAIPLGREQGQGPLFADEEYWCGVRKSQIEFAISVSICYGASLGGMATLTGTSTNLVLNGVLQSNFTNAVPISFGTFILVAGPVAFATLLALWVHLCWKMRMKSTPPLLLQQASWKDYLCIALINLTPRGYQPFPHGSTLAAEDGNNNAGRDEREREEEGINNEFAREYAALPPMSWEEKVILADFVAIALLWFFRDPKGYPGWTSLLPEPSYVTDGTVAMMGALALFVIPRREFFRPPSSSHARLPGEEEEEGEEAMEASTDPRARSHTQASTSTTSSASSSSTTATRHRPKTASATEPFGVLPWELVLRQMPWNVLWLVGGGLALSLAFKESKLSRLIATAFAGVDSVPFPLVVLSVVVVVILVSNFISNVACANIVLPPLGCIAVHLGRHPLALMLPATLAGSFAFISPIATPANAIAYSMGALSVSELARVGSVLTLISLCMLVLLFPPLFGAQIDGSKVPVWAYAGC